MISILSSSQIREADRYTIEHEPVSSIDLMERAAGKFTEAFIEMYPAPGPAYVFCGYGNNGGDGLAIARMLLRKNYQASVYILADKKDYSSDFLINKSRLVADEKNIVSYLDHENQFPYLPPGSVVIDALFGSGLNRPLSGLSQKLVDHLNRADVVRIAVDIPSGLLADQFTDGTVFHAHQTITFQQPKLSFFFPENSEATGVWTAVDIGLHKDFIDSSNCSFFLVEKEDMKKILRPRKKFDHKGVFGHAFIHAGHVGKMGAAILCAKACVRSGAGLTTIHVPKGQSSSLNVTIPEVMTEEYDGKGPLQKTDLAKFSACAFGPGIGIDRKAKEIFLDLLKKMKLPAVLDADALNILAGVKDGLKRLPENSIITPHPKEFARLAGKTGNWQERLELQTRFSVKYSCYIVLKGAHTCISAPDGKCYFNATGNPGLAKGGSGDVLTGMICSFLAQKYKPVEACLLGVFLHGLAADIALGKESEYSLLPSDVINSIGEAFREVSA